MKRIAITSVAGLLALTPWVFGAFSETVDCGSSALDRDVPTSGSMTGTSKLSPQEAVNSIVLQASGAECGPCVGTGCYLSGAGGASNDITPGDGGFVFYGQNEEWYGITVLWGDDGALRVSCSTCE